MHETNATHKRDEQDSAGVLDLADSLSLPKGPMKSIGGAIYALKCAFYIGYYSVSTLYILFYIKNHTYYSFGVTRKKNTFRVKQQ